MGSGTSSEIEYIIKIITFLENREILWKGTTRGGFRGVHKGHVSPLFFPRKNMYLSKKFKNTT